MEKIDLSFVFPCLNEEHTVPIVIKELKDILDKTNISAEIILSDNGSTDSSVELAKKYGGDKLRVVHALEKGYGEALKCGFNAAKGKYIAFADIDGSYPLEYLPKMYDQAVLHNADMVVASRMKGKIEKGAMPFLHRYLGTPVLTKIINFLFNGKLSDCNSGFRLIKKEAYQTWNIGSSGMEFASELLVKALKNNADIIEIPAGLRVDKRETPPHLRTWRDGMRHLLFILSEAPKFFEILGISVAFMSVLLWIIATLVGPLNVGKIAILDYHSKLIFLIGMILGLQCWFFSIFLYLTKPEDHACKLTNSLITLKEETLFFFLFIVLLLMSIALCGFVIYWAMHGYHNIFAVSSLIDIIFVSSFFLILCSELLQIHILQRSLKK